MCGLVGVGSITPVRNRDWLLGARDAMLHRGPDDGGEWWSEEFKVGLGHRRLSIIDLTPLGHQPMQMDDAGLVVVFNGEIYNHRELRLDLEVSGYHFKSGSDTEVILAAYAKWGEQCVSRLNGMFTFAIYDSKRSSLFLARDRAGEKPLFYILSKGVLQFASELKALMANPSNSLRIDADALDCYLAMGYVPGDRCILYGFRKLPPAHAMRFDLQTGQAKVWRYWQIPECNTALKCSSEDALVDELEFLMETSVRKQMVSDVPVGVLLSGGIDSSLITAMAARGSSNVQTFTVGFPGHGEMDETQHARLIANHFGTQHTELMAEEASAEILPHLARQFDEPMVDSSMIPTFLVSQLVSQHCKVALGGDGGDELFGGYPHYSRFLWMQKNLGTLPRFLRQSIALCAQKYLPLGYKGRNWAQSIGVDFQAGLPFVNVLFDAPTRTELLKRHVNLPLSAEMIRDQSIPLEPNLIERATRMDFKNYLAEDILVKVDRASMLSSLEMRAPFLDRDILKFAFEKVPPNLKATSYDKKILLKRLSSRVLPAEFDKNRKQGFSIPLSKWLQGGAFGNLFNDVLRDPQCIFNRNSVEGLFRGHKKGRNNGERLFALVLFELWRREYQIAI